MPRDISQEIEEMASKLSKSEDDSKEVLFKTIQSLGADGIKERLPLLSEDEKVVLKAAIEEMTMKKAKSIEFDKEAQGAKHIQGNIMDTIIQEEKADDDADEKLVKPEAAKHSHQGNSVEGWEGQVIKGEKDPVEEKHEMKAEEKQQDKEKSKVGKYKEGKSMKKSFEEMYTELKKSEDMIVKAICRGCEMGMDKDKMSSKLEEKGMPSKKVKKMMKKAMKQMDKEKAKKQLMAMEEKEHGTKDPKKLVEEEKKEHMKKAQILAEEKQLGDTDQMTKEAKKMEDETQDPAKANKQAQKDVNNMKVEGMQKSVTWSDEHTLLKARTQGRNFHFNVGSFVEEMLKSDVKTTPTTEIAKSETKKEDINEIIEKSMDRSSTQEEMTKALERSKGQQTGKLVKSFEDNDLAKILGLSEEEAKKILG